MSKGYGFNASHTLAYSLIALQEMNLAYCFPIIFWNCACLISDSGGNEGAEEDEEDIAIEETYVDCVEEFEEYPVDVLSKVFDFGDMEYFAGIKMFNQIRDKLGVNMAHQDRYELFDRIYQERKREKKRVNSRTLR